ncbi:hypothetical protein [Massilioclostridium coli]|uniref:hypothetical protein n=1 Tax=Massilioclostridium coli TaxID=1870991 RepID=UPI00085CE034|nr:hypothetical protein [Massilioclostridium coli]
MGKSAKRKTNIELFVDPQKLERTEKLVKSLIKIEDEGEKEALNYIKGFEDCLAMITTKPA